MGCSPAEAAAATAPTVYKTGSMFMFAEKTTALGTDAGLRNGFQVYVAGRGGVLGDVHPDVIVSAFGWFAPALVTKMWTGATEVVPARRCAEILAEGAAVWGRDTLTGAAGLDRFVEVGRKAIDSVAPMGMALFSGWRAMPVPDDTPAAAALTLHVLRELRGDFHLHAAAVEGLTALDGVVAEGGPDRAKQFGWAEPYPDQAGLAHVRERANAVTDAMVATVFGALTDDERADLVTGVEAIGAAVA